MNHPDEQPAALWTTRRKLAEEQCARLVAQPDDEEAAAEILRCAGDSKWEVRKVVAENMAAFPEKVFRGLSTLFASDRNALVVAAFQRSLSRRSPIAEIAPAHTDLVQGEFDRLARRFGPEAADAALKFAERCTFLHIRAAVHDIKNILTYLKLDPEAIIQEPDDPKHRSKIQRFKKGRDYLHRLLEMMDAYSSPLDIRLQAEDLVEMVHESISAARDQIEKEGVDYEPVECDVEAVDPVIIQVSRFHIVMVLTNLVKNGIQAHAVSDRRLGEGRVVISIERGEDGVMIKISDNGRGVAPGDLQKLVQFIPGGTSKRGGSGYGLPICRRYVQAHAGRMQIESEENAGTTVTINLPCNGQQADS